MQINAFVINKLYVFKETKLRIPLVSNTLLAVWVASIYLRLKNGLLLLKKKIFFSPCPLACGTLVPLPRIEPAPLAVNEWSPTHRTAREFSKLSSFECILYSLFFFLDFFFSWMWIIFKVFIEFAILLFFFIFWFYSHKACGGLAPRPQV